MRVSLEWLKQFVDIDVGPEELGAKLSLSGTKLETLDRPGDAIHGVVVAEVLAVEDHPNADNLTLVDVEAGGSTHRVVCGAKNFGPGDRVPLAVVGARLPGLTITERKIRGQVSQGMLCSGAELGLSRDHSGILVLPPDVAAGADVVGALGLDDTWFQFEITPDRPDCMGVIGIAREVAALLGSKLEIPEVGREEGKAGREEGKAGREEGKAGREEGKAPEGEEGESAGHRVEVELEDATGCPRYVARYIEALAVAPSPAWLAARLMGAGVRPISNVVDVTNYMLLETGHPLHAFDASKVTDSHIVVRRAAPGERLKTLDGVDRVMHQEDLLIADPARPLALAGIMGGEDSEVSSETTAVILEAAYFDSATVGRTSRRHVLRTEASARFERGADPEAPPYAAARTAELMAALAGGGGGTGGGGTGGGGRGAAMTDVCPQPIERARVSLRPERTAALLGYDLEVAEQESHLESIGLDVTRTDGRIEAEIPGWRPDLRREEDLIEEVARLAGFDRLPETLPAGLEGALETDQALERRLRRTLAGAGMREAWTSSLSSPHALDALGLGADHPARRMVELDNPMLDDESALRTTLLPGLLRAAAHNLAHRVEGVALFEISRVYEPAGELPRETVMLGAIWSGTRMTQGWRRPESKWDFFSAKGVLEALFEAVGPARPGWSPVSGMPLHPTRAANLSLGEVTAGTLGELHPEVCDRFEVAPGTVVAELALPALFDNLPQAVKVAAVPRFPAVYIDIAVVVDEAVPAQTVEVAIAQAGAPEVTSLRLFDLYRGAQVARGRKSLAYALELRVPQVTLTDADALRVRDRIVAALKDSFDAELRA